MPDSSSPKPVSYVMVNNDKKKKKNFFITRYKSKFILNMFDS